MAKKVNLQQIADELSMMMDEVTVFYNVDTGELMPWYDDYDNEEFWGDAEDVDEYEEIHDVTLIRLPDRFEINEYHFMEAFIDELDDEKQKRALSKAIRGRGAFRTFRDQVEDFGLLDEWYAFKDIQYLKIAGEWCERHGLKQESTLL